MNDNETKHAEFSPSGFERKYHCPASYLLEKGKPDVPSAMADEGTRLHGEIAGIIRGTLNEVDADPLAQRCYTRFVTALDAFENPAVYVEKTLAGTVAGVENFGTVDALAIGGEDALLFDWKTGYNKVTAPANNWQLKWYAVFVFENFPAVQGVKAVVFNPRIWQDEGAYFKRADVERIKAELGEVISVCKAGSPSPCVGEWCDYCKGKAECPAVKNALQALENPAPLSAMGESDLLALYAKIDAVKGICDEITNEVKARIREHGTYGGYEIRTISGATDITDNAEMLDALAGVLTPKEIASTAKYSVTAIADAVYSKRKQAGKKVTKVQAKADVMQALSNAGCIKKRPDTERVVKR